MDIKWFSEDEAPTVETKPSELPKTKIPFIMTGERPPVKFLPVEDKKRFNYLAGENQIENSQTGEKIKDAIKAARCLGKNIVGQDDKVYVPVTDCKDGKDKMWIVPRKTYERLLRALDAPVTTYATFTVEPDRTIKEKMSALLAEGQLEMRLIDLFNKMPVEHQAGANLLDSGVVKITYPYAEDPKNYHGLTMSLKMFGLVESACRPFTFERVGENWSKWASE